MWLPLLPLPLETKALAIKAKLCFADLPAELRNEIYTQALVRRKPVVLPYAYQRDGAREPALLHVCRWMRAEATPIYYGRNVFQAPSPPSAHRFLQQLGPHKIAHLRSFRPVDLISPAPAHPRWLDATRRQINRLVEQCGHGTLSADAICIPMRDEQTRVRWVRLNEIERVEVVAKPHGGWSLEWRDG